jgi:hypothetical protein
MGRDKRTAKSGAKPPTKKAAARNTSDMAPPNHPRDIADLQGASVEMRDSFRAHLYTADNWATGNEQSFEGLNERLDEGDDRMDRIERLVRDGFAAMAASFAQLHRAPVAPAAPQLEEADGTVDAQVNGGRTESDAPVVDAGKAEGGEGQGEQEEAVVPEVQHEDEEEEEEEVAVEVEEQAEEVAAEEGKEAEGHPDPKYSGLYATGRFDMKEVNPETDPKDFSDPEEYMRKARKASRSQASDGTNAVETAPKDDDQSTKSYSMRKRKESQIPPPAKTRKPRKTKETPTLQSIDEGREENDEDGQEAGDNDQAPRSAFIKRPSQPSKGKKRKAEQSDAAHVENGKLKSPSSLLNGRADSDTDDEEEDRQPRKKRPKKASRKEPESESELEQAPKKGKQDKKPKARTAEGKK